MTGRGQAIQQQMEVQHATLRAEIDPGDVDSMLFVVDKAAATAEDRHGAMSWVLNTVRRDGHLAGDGEKVAMTLLWLICRSPTIGPLATTLAREVPSVHAITVGARSHDELRSILDAITTQTGLEAEIFE